MAAGIFFLPLHRQLITMTSAKPIHGQDVKKIKLLEQVVKSETLTVDLRLCTLCAQLIPSWLFHLQSLIA
ncbi:hypothetical protein Mal48_31390 [Thalassoglobus polymorphus]|uniref:Uncharacterized protein n=1 Tax=Thalassoglobus polymorphus TaxID=2527994 RepID=A0A517QQK4_9PLAN|nr:hypothetical protein Mal48_31390 [Thalassoglobus polymorphus]